MAMELIPEVVNGAVVFTLHNSCGANKAICGNCADFAVSIHNWLMNTEIRYVVIDLQDEKEICPAFLEEILQLRKRLKMPFVFAGVMEKPKRIMDSYAFDIKNGLFITPEQALDAIEEKHRGLTKVSLHGLQLGQPIAVSKPRHSLVADELVDGESVDE